MKSIALKNFFVRKALGALTVAIIAVGVAVPCAQANTIEYIQESQWVGTGHIFLFPQFDPRLGTLTEVSFKTRLNAEQRLDLDIPADQPLGEYFVSVDFPNGASVPILGLNIAGTDPFHLEVRCVNTSRAGCSASTGTLYFWHEASSYVSTNFTPLIGDGTFAVNADMFPQGHSSGPEGSSLFPGEVYLDSSGYITGAEVTTTYTFDPVTSVPEPATMLLLGLGLIGVVGIRRKLKK